MISLTNFFQNQISSKQGVEIFRKLVITNLKGTQDIDISSFVTSWGNISRKLQYETGRFSPGGHSFTIANTKDLGKFLFTLGQEFGTEFWMDKTYDISVGFLNGQTEDVINVGTFEMFSKRENRIDGGISVSSKDVIKKINDFRVCTKIPASDVFATVPVGESDARSFTQILKYGTHELINNSSDSSEFKERKNPFSITVGFQNINIGDISGGGASHPINHVFYFPFQNDIDITSTLFSDGTLKLYFWDYIDDIWRAFSVGEFTSNITVEKANATGTHDGSSGAAILSDSGASFIIAGVKVGQVILNTTDGSDAKISAVTTTTITGALNNGTDNDWDTSDSYEVLLSNGIYITIELPDSISIEGDAWTKYLNPVDSNAHFKDPDKLDIALAIESIDNLTDANPARIIHDLLTSSRFMNLSATQLDFSSFSSPDEDFSFDKTFKFIDEAQGKVNVSFNKETSVLKVIESIIKVGAMFFFTTAKKSTSLDNRIKLEIQQPFRTCSGDIPNFLEFSTKDYIESFELETTSDTVVSQVRVSNFNTSVSSKDNLETKSQPSVSPANGKVLQLGTSSDPDAYWYNSSGWAQAIAGRFFNWLNNPIEKINISLGKAGFPVELFDLISVHDAISDKTITVQVFDTRLSLGNMNVSINGKRFENLFGPDVDEPLKKWSFATTDSDDPCAAFATTNEAPNGKPTEPQINASWHTF